MIGLTDALKRWAPRMIANGVDACDLERIRREAGDDWVAWFRAMVGCGGQYEEMARAAYREGRGLTAGELWVRAGLLHHFAQFALFEHPDLRAEGQRRKEQAFELAAPLLRPAMRRVEVAHDHCRLPAWLRIPHGVKEPVPWVLMVPGLDSSKEEFFTFAELFLARGMAVAAVDGPGQGEVGAAGRPWRPGDEAAVVTVLAQLKRLPGLDPSRCGVLGVSFGGYLAPAAAALAAGEVAACAGIGGCFSLAGPDWERLPPLIQVDFQHFCGAPDAASARELALRVRLADRVAGLRCPLLLVHGDHDGIFPLDHAERAAATAGRAKSELRVLAGGNHVCNNMPHRYRPYVADWFAARLQAPSHD